MKKKAIENEIQTQFPAALASSTFFSKLNILLEEDFNFNRYNTQFAEGFCCDEINEPELAFMDKYWGNRFKFGGLAGYCHAGKTGLSAVTHHVPDGDSLQNLILIGGPHIGYYDGEWGKVKREGQSSSSTSCGALALILKNGYHYILNRPANSLDLQQQAVETLVLPYLKSCEESKTDPSLLKATRFLLDRTQTDLLAILQQLENDFDGQIAVLTGITINTEVGNYFSRAYLKIHNGQSSSQSDLLTY